MEVGRTVARAVAVGAVLLPWKVPTPGGIEQQLMKENNAEEGVRLLDDTEGFLSVDRETEAVPVGESKSSTQYTRNRVNLITPIRHHVCGLWRNKE